MANTSAVIIWDSRDREEALLLASPSDLAVVTPGAGRLLHQGYISVGCALEKTAGQFAHKVGLGPTATSFRIEKALGNDAHTRQSTLDSIYDSFREGMTTQPFRALKKECQKLLKYALPSQSPATQIRSLRSIIMLTTRYPSLRRVFLQSPDIKKVAHSPDAICDLWRNTEYTYDRESRFTLEFAAHCLAGSGPCNDLEDIRPSELGCTRVTGLGVLDILVVGYCNEGSGFPRLIAIRYLAGILELPAFWFEDYYQVHKHTMNQLCKQTLRLIEDINPDSVSADDVARLASLDPDGVDALAEAVLVGGGIWIRRMPRTQGLNTDYWFSNFIKLIDMLRGLIISDFLPLASRRAAENWEDLLKDTTDQLPKSSSDWQYEDDYIIADGPRSAGPSQSGWRPSDIPKESLNVGNEQPSALLKVFTTFRETFFRRTTSKIGKTPPDFLTAEGVNRENYVQETTEGGTSVEETGEAESILHPGGVDANGNRYGIPSAYGYDQGQPLPYPPHVHESYGAPLPPGIPFPGVPPDRAPNRYQPGYTLSTITEKSTPQMADGTRTLPGTPMSGATGGTGFEPHSPASIQSELGYYTAGSSVPGQVGQMLPSRSLGTHSSSVGQWE